MSEFERGDRVVLTETIVRGVDPHVMKVDTRVENFETVVKGSRGNVTRVIAITLLHVEFDGVGLSVANPAFVRRLDPVELLAELA